jgi:Domain of unknown function (DUF4386)
MALTARHARAAGFLYLLDVVVTPIRLSYIPDSLIVAGNAAATANSIALHESLFRFGIVSDLFCGVLEIFLVLALYRLFNRVDRKQAVLMVVLGVMTAPIFFLNALNDSAVLMVLNGADVLSAFAKPQRDALVMLFLQMHDQEILAAEVFWGIWLFPLAILIIRSGFLPRFLGFWLIVNGIAWLALSFTGIQLPHYADIVGRYTFPALLGEVAFMLWILVMGAKEPRGVP